MTRDPQQRAARRRARREAVARGSVINPRQRASKQASRASSPKAAAGRARVSS
jgi:hypothetical protein